MVSQFCVLKSTKWMFHIYQVVYFYLLILILPFLLIVCIFELSMKCKSPFSSAGCSSSAHARRNSPSFPISQCRRTSRGRELMGRLLILIFLKVTNAPLLTRFTVSALLRIRVDAQVRTDCLQLDLTQTEALVPEKRLSSSSLSLSANATGLHDC